MAGGGVDNSKKGRGVGRIAVFFAAIPARPSDTETLGNHSSIGVPAAWAWW
eukprot:CAMPEP_0167808002 /NCGR_PEP_ID=MMETSP0111_2-20121227/22911_1 /TAXON_ID=91324 /ORGANISM="Lotharella globosa, Strain CCCM811" /LENGTH=50 /DNA_ID=CAMNT_0007706057 /DNA_START=575 /DNA_END=724 /DNA_ORIENTATION=+